MKENTHSEKPDIELVLFDFGGVLAEEGFREGLMSIARSNGLEPLEFYGKAVDIISETGYLTGCSDEKTFWQTLRRHLGVKGSDETLRNEILSRFAIRQWMIDIIKGLKKLQVRLAVLSDQTNWLDELDAEHDFLKFFDRVFNSFHMKKSKHDPSIFDDVLSFMGVTPDKSLFIDDRIDNVERAKQRGLKTILYRKRVTFEQELACFFPALK